MMGPRQVGQGTLFYEFSLDTHVPTDHLLRSINPFVDLTGLRQELAPFYASTGRPSVDPELMIRMLIVGYCLGIRSERRLCDEVHLNLAYRWFCRLGLDGRVPDHSTFSKNRHGRFRDSDLLRRLFETVLARCIAEGLVGGEGFAVDGSLIKADANRQKGVEGSAGLPPEVVSRAAQESGRAAVQVPAASWIDEEGAVIPRIRLLRPLEREGFGVEELARSHWQPADTDTFAVAWEAECAALPEFCESTLHVVTGLLLPVWQRLPREACRVVRLQTDDGQHLIGWLVPLDWVAAAAPDEDVAAPSKEAASRHIEARFALHQDLQTLLRCHMRAFTAIGGVPIEILYDRMKTAGIGEDEAGHIVYNRSLVALAKHYGFLPRACRPYRPKTKGKVERPFSYIRQDFFLARSFRNLDDMNAQLQVWLNTVANVHLHGTTQKIVSDAFAAERPELQPLPGTPFEALLRLERRVSHDGLVSIGGNDYSVPDRTRRIVEVHQLSDSIRILGGGRLVASHPVLEGRRQYRVDPDHRQGGQARAMRYGHPDSIMIGRRGDHVAQRPLAFYQAVGESLAAEIGARS